ncbi:Cytochrome c3 [Ferrimonas sediminum]|uniref:Cytochrome c3 n=1 Tax=Ferrimonas sediminum TaxID=718193 RepID=A0A1G8NPJ9_9GAMM|nr:cytochrome c3 family protein [Ferrimonas sediminum]SDI82047.1 Cytochrome c3 [Ferrimonas sediminum]
MKSILLTLALGLALTATAQAGELTKVKGSIKGRDNHQFLYEEGCKACHSGSAKKYVDDSACQDCHGNINDIEITRELVLEEANPHKSIHFNQGASCLACHAEHQQKAPVCSECHRTWFDVM